MGNYCEILTFAHGRKKERKKPKSSAYLQLDTCLCLCQSVCLKDMVIYGCPQQQQHYSMICASIRIVSLSLSLSI